MTLNFTPGPGQIANRTDLLATVMAQFHAIPSVVAAPPGILPPRFLNAWSPRLAGR